MKHMRWSWKQYQSCPVCIVVRILELAEKEAERRKSDERRARNKKK